MPRVMGTRACGSPCPRAVPCIGQCVLIKWLLHCSCWCFPGSRLENGGWTIRSLSMYLRPQQTCSRFACAFGARQDYRRRRLSCHGDVRLDIVYIGRGLVMCLVCLLEFRIFSGSGVAWVLEGWMRLGGVGWGGMSGDGSEQRAPGHPISAPTPTPPHNSTPRIQAHVYN
jgi:hypothetical protein